MNSRATQPLIVLSARRKMFYAAWTTFLFVAALELGLRTVAYATGRGFAENPAYGFTSPFITGPFPPQPNISRELAECYGRSLPRHKPPGEVRVLCFGGSTTVNRRGGPNWPAMLEEKFAERFGDRRVVVLRAACNAYSSAHSLVNLSLRCLDVDPDVIVVYHNVNDESVLRYGDWISPDYGNKYLSSEFLAYRHRTGFLAASMKVSRLLRYLEQNVARVRYSLEPPEHLDVERGVEIFGRNLMTMVGVARVHDVDIVLASQAARSDLRARESWQAYDAVIESVSREQAVPFVDVAEQVTDDSLFVDQAHNTTAGMKAVATAFYPTLLEVVESRVSAGGR